MGYEIGSTRRGKIDEMDSGIPICQKVENLQHPECTARHRITKHSHWLMTYCDLGIAWFWLVICFETGNSKAAGWWQTISQYCSYTEHWNMFSKMFREGLDSEEDHGSGWLTTD